jgi:hypothetical protein
MTLFIRLDEPHRRVSLPEVQAVGFILGFHVGYSDLQHSGSPVSQLYRSHPGARRIFVWGAWNQPPLLLQAMKNAGQFLKPCDPLVRLPASDGRAIRNREAHSYIMNRATRRSIERRR